MSFSEAAYQYPALQNVLTRVVREKLGISGEEKQEVRQLSIQVGKALRRGLQKSVAELKFPDEPERIGSTAEDLKIPGNQECDYLLHIDIAAGYGSLALETPGSEGYFRVVLMHSVPKMNKMLLKSGSMEYLSPMKVHAYLVGKLTNVLEQANIGLCARAAPFGINGVTNIVHQSNQAGPNLKLEVFYNSGRSSFDMDFVPCLNIQDNLLVAKCHPSLGPMHTLTASDPSTLRWRQTMGPTETAKIAPLDKGNGGWSKQVCRLAKYLRSKHPQFHAFPSYIYKTVFLHLLDEYHYPTEWRENNLANRFLDFMKKFEKALLCKELDHYFLLKRRGVKRNLLRPRFKPLVIEEVGQYVARLNRKGAAAYVELFTGL
ncbi:uncharacterized protein LOC135500727 [Lineus longissimus]|uniref:uncharacterized protein LOC135500727 n=1 Tax=Lineus longissimus TaxID=88925 RepID=UPI00315CABA0